MQKAQPAPDVSTPSPTVAVCLTPEEQSIRELDDTSSNIFAHSNQSYHTGRSTTPISGPSSKNLFGDSKETPSSTTLLPIFGKSGKDKVRKNLFHTKSDAGKTLQTCSESRTCFKRSGDCDSIFSGADYPEMKSNESLLEGTMHVILLDDSTPVTCDNIFELEQTLLVFLADNIGSQDTYRPVCVRIVEYANDEQQVDGVFVESIALKIELTFIETLARRLQKVDRRELVKIRRQGNGTSSIHRSSNRLSPAFHQAQDELLHKQKERLSIPINHQQEVSGGPRQTMPLSEPTSTASADSLSSDKPLGPIFGKSQKEEHFKSDRMDPLRSDLVLPLDPIFGKSHKEKHFKSEYRPTDMPSTQPSFSPSPLPTVEVAKTTVSNVFRFVSN